MSLATHRSRGVGETIDAAFTFYRANFATILTVAMLVIAPPAILKAVTPTAFERIFDFAGNLLLPIGLGAIAAIVAAAVERNETLTVGDAFRSAGNQAGSLIAVQIVTGLMFLIGFVLLVVPGVIVLAWTAVAMPVVMIEQRGYSKAIGRSRALARGRLKYVLGTLILSWGLALLLMIGVGALAGLLGGDVRIMNFLSQTLFAVVIPVPAIAVTFPYYELRVQTEGADLDAMISELPAPMATP